MRVLLVTKRLREKYEEFLERTGGDEELAIELLMRYRCLTDLYYLGTVVLGLGKATEGGRKRIDPKFHRWVAAKLQENKDGLYLLPRGHMKSAWMKVKIVQLILQRPNIRIGLFSRTSNLVEAQLSELKVHLSNPLLIRLFPDILVEPGRRNSNWVRSTASELTVRRDPVWGRIPQENQVEAWGVDATITGRHYDVIIMDDILNEQSVSTPEQIKKIRDWYTFIQSIKDPLGFEVMIGTRYHYADLYGTVIAEGWYGKRVFVRAAIENGKPIYSFFTLKMLAKIKQRMTRFEWSCQYMNDPLPQEDKIFPAPIPQYTELPPDAYKYYITCDPAATTEVYSDQTAICVTAVNRLGQMYVLEALGVKIPPNEVADLLVKKIARYRPERVGIELGLQTALMFVLETKIAEWEREHGQPLIARDRIEPITISRKMSKANRVNRSLGAFCRDGKLLVHASLQDLLLQMEYFPKGERDDIVDCLSMQMQIVREYARGYWTSTGAREDQPRKMTFFDLFAPKPKNTWEAKFVS